MNIKKHKKVILKIGLLLAVLGIILLYLFNTAINNILNIVLISFSCAYVLKPVRILIQNKLKLGRRAASLILIFLILGITAASMIMIIPKLLDEINNISDIIESITVFFERFIEKIKFEQFPFGDVIYNGVSEKFDRSMISLSESLMNNILSLSNEIISLTVLPIIIYYFMADGSKIYNKLLLVIPAEKRKITKKVFLNIDKVLQRYILGQLMLSGLIGILTLVVMIIFRVKFPIWISMLNAVFNIIPYFGPVFGALPAIIIAFIDSTSKGIYITISMFIIQQIEGNIFSPKITGDSVEMHPVLIIILLLIGDKIGGFLGMVTIIPIAVVIKVIYDDINYYFF